MLVNLPFLRYEKIKFTDDGFELSQVRITTLVKMNGIEIQPDTTFLRVTVSFKQNQIKFANECNVSLCCPLITGSWTLTLAFPPKT